MKKAVLFVRVSTEKQTLESQIEALKRSASVDGFGDNDIIVIAKKESGVKLKEAEREGLNELKDVIEKNDVDCVYIFELSRLSRDPMTLYSAITYYLTPKGNNVYLCSQKWLHFLFTPFFLLKYCAFYTLSYLCI